MGDLINPATFSRTFGDFIKKNNLKHVRLHDLRHTNATLMLKSNIPAKIASERLGHSNISTTLDLYSHVLDDMERETSDKLDNMIFNSK
jgi:integrase